jgi:hypothetical protein
MQEYDYLKSMQQYLSMALKGMIHGAISLDGDEVVGEVSKKQQTIDSLFEVARQQSAK